KINEYIKDLSENSTDDELNTEKLNNNIDFNQKHEDIKIKTNNTIKKNLLTPPEKVREK
ncbi:8764_t:CDS:1, partial [Gigaspora margarita]